MRSIILAGAVAAFATTALIGGAQAQSAAPPQFPATLPVAPKPVTPALTPAAPPVPVQASGGTALQAPAQLPAPSACPGNPDALGVSRTIAIDPRTSPLLGRLQYKQTLPLEKGEVVLTFDDGPLPPMTNRVLDTLARECVKATFFIVGRMAGAYPHVLQRVSEEGHTIGTHSQTHPLIFPKLTQEAGLNEIEQGFKSVNAALAPINAHTVPFFRFPGLGRTKFYEAYAQQHGLAVFSVDAVADDWMHLKPDEVEKRALDRLTANGGGILLLHDIQPSTAVMLPSLLRELKARGFKIVHVVNATPGMIASLPTSGPHASAAAAASAPPATAAAPTAAKPAALNPVAAKPAAPKPVAAKPAPPKPAAADAVASAPLPPAAPAPDASSRTAAQPDNPFSLFWPRLWTDALPKGLQ